MKRLWLAAVLLAAVFAVALWNSASLREFTGEISAILQEAGAEAADGSWDQAARLTGRAREIWEDQDVYLHITLRHADTDEIYACFQEVEALLSSREWGEYAAANARLITRMELLWESEAPTLKNFL